MPTLKEKLKALAIKNGFFISKTTENKKLADFLRLIRPIKTDIDLIKIGGQSDGGYLIPNDLNGIKNCFSPGVSCESFFENDLAKLGIKSYMADYSVNHPAISNKSFDFIKKYIGFENDDNFISLENWIDEKEKFDNNMLLQMDIEGGEYNVIIDSSRNTLARFRIILIEFHEFDNLFNPKSFDLIAACFHKLLNDFYIVHIHPNNCSKTIKFDQYEIPPVLEFTFLRKDRVSSVSYETHFPHILDSKNNQNKDEIILHSCFYMHV